MEAVTEKRIPGLPDKALVKAATLSIAEIRISWTLDDEGKKQTQALFLESGKEYVAENNTLLVAKLMTAIAEMQSRLEEFEGGAG